MSYTRLLDLVYFQCFYHDIRAKFYVDLKIFWEFFIDLLLTDHVLVVSCFLLAVILILYFLSSLSLVWTYYLCIFFLYFFRSVGASLFLDLVFFFFFYSHVVRCSCGLSDRASSLWSSLQQIVCAFLVVAVCPSLSCFRFTNLLTVASALRYYEDLVVCPL